MSADTQAFFALDRKATEEFLLVALSNMDDITLKNAVHTLISSYNPSLLKGLSKEIVPASGVVLESMQTNVHDTEPLYVAPPCVLDVKPLYVAPPRVRDAEQFWPYARCKNVARALKRYNDKTPIPRNHHALLEYIAQVANVNVETLKKTSPRVLFKNNNSVIWVLETKCI